MKHATDIEAHALRCLIALVREFSVTRAAAALGMGQPALSHVLALLRQRFSDPLLVRGAHGMVPTPRALQLADAAEAVLQGMKQLHTVAGAFDPAQEDSRFIMTVTDYFEKLLAPPLMERLRVEAPGVCVEWRSPNPRLVREWLETGKIDLRIAWVHAPWQGLRFLRLFSDRLVCLAREGHPGVGRRLSLAQFMAASHVRPAIAVASRTSGRFPPVLSLEEYLGLPESKLHSLPARPRPVGSERPATWQALRSAKVRVSMLAESFLAIPSLVVQSDLLATVPHLVIKAQRPIDKLRVLAPPLELPGLQGALYWHERTNNDPRQRWFRRLVTSVAKSAVA